MAKTVRSQASETVSIVGLDALVRDLKAAKSDLAKRLQVANNDAAAVVLRRAVQLRDSQPGAARKTTVKTGNQANRASLVIGSTQEPWALGAEFGAKRFKQFQPWTGNQWVDGRGEQWAGPEKNVGYFLHPAIRDTRDEFLAEYERQLDIIMDALARG